MEHRSDAALYLGHVECVDQFSPSTEGLIQGDLGEDVSDSMVDLFLRQDLVRGQPAFFRMTFPLTMVVLPW